MKTSRSSGPLLGFSVALALTLGAFASIRFKTFDRHTTMLAIALMGALQIMVHFRYFLGLGLGGTSRDRLVTLGFTALILSVMVAGSLWILGDLKMRMM